MISGVVVGGYCLRGTMYSNSSMVLPALGAAIIAIVWLAEYSVVRRLRRFQLAMIVALCAMLLGGLLVGMVSGAPLTKRIVSLKHSLQDSGALPKRGRGGAGKGSGLSGSNQLDLDPPDLSGRAGVVAYLTFKKSRSRSGPIYLRKAGLSRFDGHRWDFTKGDMEIIVDEHDEREDGWTQVDPKSRGRDIRYTVHLPDVTAPWLITLPNTTRFQLPGIRVAENDTYYAPSKRGGFISYRAAASPKYLDEIDSPKLQVGQTNEDNLSLPEGPLSERIRKLADWVVEGAATPRDRIYELKTFLKDEFKYEIRRDKRASLEDFAFDSMRGHCTMFATLYTLMLRSQGIPARVAMGLCGGAFDEKNQVYEFYNKDYHAWVEVKLKEYGWVLVDPTPVADRPIKPVSDSDFADTRDLYSPLHEELADQNAFDNTSLATGRRKRFMRLGTLALPLLVTWILSVIVLHRNRRTTGRDPIKDIGGANTITDFYIAFCRYFATAGHPRRLSQTPYEYMLALKEKKRIGDEFDDMFDYYCGVNYEGKRPSLETEKDFMRRIGALKDK
jgi:transglutaminase-like putative cysteine protease